MYLILYFLFTIFLCIIFVYMERDYENYKEMTLRDILISYILAVIPIVNIASLILGIYLFIKSSSILDKVIIPKGKRK